MRGFRSVLLLVGFTFCITIVPLPANAYSTNYYASRLNPSIDLGFQAMQVVAKDGAIYTASSSDCFIQKIVENHSAEIVAGIKGYCGYVPDGSIASQSLLTSVTSLDVASDGTIYFTSPAEHLVRAILPNGKLTTVAGNGTAISSDQRSDGPDAKQLAFNMPNYLKIGPDGALYIHDIGVVRRVFPNGLTDHVVGGYDYLPRNSPYVEGGIASQQYFSTADMNSNINNASPTVFDFDTNKNLYVTLSSNIYRVNRSDNRIYKISTTLNNPSNTLEDSSLTTTKFASGTAFDIDDQNKVWGAGGSQETGTAIRFLDLSDLIVRTASGGGTISQLHIGGTPIPGVDLRLSSLRSVSVNKGNVYFISNYISDVGAIKFYVGKLSTSRDSTPPRIQPTLSPIPNSNGWNNTPTTLTWTVDDSESTITSLQGCEPLTISSQTSGQVITCSATSAGGTSTNDVTVKLDSTKPTVTKPILKNSIKIPSFGYLFTRRSTVVTIQSKVTDNLSGITAAEYYLDKDPGKNNGVPMTITDGYASATIMLSQVPKGKHTIFVRALDAAGNWSETKSVRLTKL